MPTSTGTAACAGASAGGGGRVRGGPAPGSRWLVFGVVAGGTAVVGVAALLLWRRRRAAAVVLVVLASVALVSPRSARASVDGDALPERFRADYADCLGRLTAFDPQL